MLERDMEISIANCPALFIEPGLSLVRRQVVINGRRPDILFRDALDRDLLVEVQKGRLDEHHLQRHFYYFYDYRAKFPGRHLRLMFVANRLVPQHKEFLDDHGYEYREHPEADFQRRATQCNGQPPSLPVEVEEELSVLSAGVHSLLYELETQKMTLSYKMLLVTLMVDLADKDGKVLLSTLAERFQEYFIARAAAGKAEENPRVVEPGVLSSRSVSQWEQVIVDQPVRHIGEEWLRRDGDVVSWAPRIRGMWNATLANQLRDSAQRRLINYFNGNVPGGA